MWQVKHSSSLYEDQDKKRKCSQSFQPYNYYELQKGYKKWHIHSNKQMPSEEIWSDNLSGDDFQKSTNNEKKGIYSITYSTLDPPRFPISF